jgi:hypothetical protein
MTLGLPLGVWNKVVGCLNDFTDGHVPGHALCLSSLSRAHRASSELLFSLVSVRGFRLTHAAPSLRTRALCMSACELFSGNMAGMEQLLASMPEDLRSDREIVKVALRMWPELTLRLPGSWGNDRDMALAVLQSPDNDALCYFQSFSTHRDVVLAAVKNCGRNLAWARGFDTDREVALAALSNDEYAVEFVSASLLCSDDFVAEAVRRNPNVLRTAGLWLNKDLAIQAVRLFPRTGLRGLPVPMRAQADIWRVAVDGDPRAIEFVPPEQCTREVMRGAIARDPTSWTLTSQWLGDQAFALSVLSAKGSLLGHRGVQRLWADNTEAVLAAVTQNGLALEFASRRLRDDAIVVERAVQQNGLSLAFASKRLRTYVFIVSTAVRQNFYALEFSFACRYVENRERARGPRLPPLPQVREDFY